MSGLFPEYRIRCYANSDDLDSYGAWSDDVAVICLGESNYVLGHTGLRRALRKLYSCGWDTNSILVEREDSTAADGKSDPDEERGSGRRHP